MLQVNSTSNDFLLCLSGANDVANSFGTSVGSKALTIGQAVMIAAVCEFAGAALLGANVIDTIKGKIAKTSAFTNTPGKNECHDGELAVFFFMLRFAHTVWIQKAHNHSKSLR